MLRNELAYRPYSGPLADLSLHFERRRKFQSGYCQAARDYEDSVLPDWQPYGPAPCKQRLALVEGVVLLGDRCHRSTLRRLIGVWVHFEQSRRELRRLLSLAFDEVRLLLGKQRW